MRQSWARKLVDPQWSSDVIGTVLVAIVCLSEHEKRGREWTMSHFDFRSVRFLQYTILRTSTRLVNIMNITSYEAHSLFIFRTARTEYTKTATTTRWTFTCRSTDVNRGNTYQSTRKVVHTSISIQGIIWGDCSQKVTAGNGQSRPHGDCTSF